MTTFPGAPTESDALHRAKRPRTPLAGPYGHPFHPMVVTIPIGTWTAAIVLDVIGFFVEDPEPFVIGARALIVIGIVGAALAALFGLMDLGALAKGTAARKTALIHMALNSTALVLFIISAVVRFAADDDEVSVAGFVLALIAFAVTGASGYLGGKLAYHFGVRVADESTQAEGFR